MSGPVRVRTPHPTSPPAAARRADPVPGRGARRPHLRAPARGRGRGPGVRAPLRRRRWRNVAVVAARHGAPVALAGGAGDDPWGRWLRERLRARGVELSLFELVPGARRRRWRSSRSTRAASRATRSTARPSPPWCMRSPAGSRRRSERSGGLFFSSNTLVGRGGARDHDACPRGRARAWAAGHLRPQPAPAPLALAGRGGRQRQRLRARRAAGALPTPPRRR